MTNKTIEDFPCFFCYETHAKTYHEIMHSVESLLPSNPHEIEISKQVKYSYAHPQKFSTSIVHVGQRCSFESRQSSIKKLPLPRYKLIQILTIVRVRFTDCGGVNRCLCFLRQNTYDEICGNTPFRHKYLNFLFDNI